MDLVLLIDSTLVKLKLLIDTFNDEKSKKMNMSLSQLKKIVLELEKMKQSMNLKLFYPTYGRILIDSWDFSEENELRNDLMIIESEYLRLK